MHQLHDWLRKIHFDFSEIKIQVKIKKKKKRKKECGKCIILSTRLSIERTFICKTNMFQSEFPLPFCQQIFSSFYFSSRKLKTKKKKETKYSVQQTEFKTTTKNGNQRVSFICFEFEISFMYFKNI